MYNACVRSVLLYASETWALNVEDTNRIKRTDHAMLRWICSVKLSDKLSMKELRSRLKLHSVEDVLSYNRLRWFGHLHRMPNELWPKMVLSFEVAGSVPRGRPRKQWKENINKDLASKKICK